MARAIGGSCSLLLLGEKTPPHAHAQSSRTTQSSCTRGGLAPTITGPRADMLSMTQRLWFGGAVTKDPAHQQAWKKRRRSATTR